MDYLNHGFGSWTARWISAIAVILLSAAGFWVYGLTILDTLKFFIGVVVLFYIPGSLLIRSVGIPIIDGLKYSATALGTGTVVVPVFYKLLRYLDCPDYIVVSLLSLCAASWLYLMIQDSRSKNYRLKLKLNDLFGILILLAFILVLLHFSHFTDVLLNTAGFQFRATDMTESVFHLGIINSLADTFPPPSLYVSGGTDFSSYHLNMHLQAELFVRLFGIEALHLVIFYMPFLYFALLVLLPYVFIRESGGIVLTGIIGAFLVFGTDFSFVPAIVFGAPPGFAWTTTFQSTIWSLFTLNGILPGVIALFLCIIVIRDYFTNNVQTSLVLFALLVYGSFGLKSSMGLQIAAASLATGLLVTFYGHNKKQGWSLVIISATTLVIMFFDIAALRTGTGDSTIVFSPLNHFFGVLKKFGISDLSGLWYLPMVFLVLLAGIGIRVLGLFLLSHHLLNKKPKNWDWTLVFIGLFFFGGYILAEMLVIRSHKEIDNSIWFYTQSLMALWFLLFLFLVRIQDRRYVFLLSASLILALATPSTVQFIKLRVKNGYVTFDQSDLKIVEYLRHTDPNSVVLHPLNLDRPSLASNFSGRASVLSVWLSFVTEAQGVSERARDTLLFFNNENNLAKRLQVLDKYHVNYVYGPTSELLFMRNIPQVELALQTNSLVLYRVSGRNLRTESVGTH